MYVITNILCENYRTIVYAIFFFSLESSEKAETFMGYILFWGQGHSINQWKVSKTYKIVKFYRIFKPITTILFITF